MISKKEALKKSESLKQLVRAIVKEEIDIPDKAVILDTDIMLELFTKKRVELIKYINSCKPTSIQDLADLVKRKKQAVFRDLKLLEGLKLISFKKKGRRVKPEVNQKVVVLNMKDV